MPTPSQPTPTLNYDNQQMGSFLYISRERLTLKDLKTVNYLTEHRKEKH